MSSKSPKNKTKICSQCGNDELSNMKTLSIQPLGVYFIVFIKIIFIILSIILVIQKISQTIPNTYTKGITLTKGIIENIYICVMSLVLIMLFNSGTKNTCIVDIETKFLLMLYGVVMIVITLLDMVHSI
jgi:hypothetical protein